MSWLRLPWILLVAASTLAAPQTRGQRQCITTLNTDALAVLGAQTALTGTCLKEETGSAAGAFDACFTNDAAPGLAAATARTTTDAVDACVEVPDLGTSSFFDQGVNTAATEHGRGIAVDLLGSSPGGAVVSSSADGPTARCQSTVLRSAGGVMAAFVRSYGACTRRTLKRGGDTTSALEACVTARAARVKGAVRALSARAKRCRRVDMTATFPGRCGPAGNPTELAACASTRALCRACRLTNATAGLDADCDLIDDGLDNASCSFPVAVSGDAIPFNDNTHRIEGATISILEQPGRQLVTGPDGHFVFDGLEEGSEVTLVMDHPDYHPIQTGTVKLGPRGIDRVTFQAVLHPIYDALALFLGVTPDEANRCQMVTTVTRLGRSLYDPGAHGEAGVTVTLSPPLPADQGPIYFNSSVLPDRSLTETSDDGGVLFIQVPPGEYRWTAHKPGAIFTRLKMKCRVGVLVNASPPRGLQIH